MKEMKRKLYLIIVVYLLTGLSLSSISSADGDTLRKKKETTNSEVSLLAVGDDLIHDSVYKAAKTKNGYNFDSVYAHTKKYIQKADLALINQETIFVDSRYSGYPAFGSPKQAGDAIAKAGFDAVTQATNHALDRGVSSILYTYNFWHNKHPNIALLGIHNSQKDANKITVVKRNGIRIAMLNYTYGLNGLRLPQGKGYLVDLLQSESKIRNDIKRAKKQSDFVIVFPHWGIEYKYQPSADQKRWAKVFASAGADLVIGTHPHVLEPCTTIKSKNHKTVVFYSLGNFVSAQTKADRALGGMAEVTIIRDQKGVRIKNYKLSGTITHKAKNQRYTVYKLDDYNNRLAKTNTMAHGTTVNGFKSIYHRATGKNYPKS